MKNKITLIIITVFLCISALVSCSDNIQPSDTEKSCCHKEISSEEKSDCCNDKENSDIPDCCGN